MAKRERAKWRARKDSSGVSWSVGDSTRKRRRRGKTARTVAWRTRRTVARIDQDMSVKPSLASHAMQEDDFFRTVHSRILNTLNKTYLLPVDHDEVQVFAYSNSRHLPNSNPAFQHPPSFSPICIRRQKLRRARKRGSPVWSTPQRFVLALAVLILFYFPCFL